MPAGLSFKKQDGNTATNLSEVKIITLQDGNGNEYTLDSTDGLKLEYKPTGGTTAVKQVNSLDSFIRALFNRKADNGMMDGTRKMTILEEEVGDKNVAETILGATSDSDGKKSILVEKLGGFLASTDKVKYDSAEDAANQTAKDFLAGKFPLVKTDGSNATKELANAILTIDGDTSGTSVLKEKAANKNVAEAILGATSDSDGKKSILVEKLGGFLEKTDEATEKVYGDSRTPSSLKVAKDFLNSKGLGTASASEVASQLLSDTKKDQLGTAILGVKKDVGGTLKPALETDLAANKTLQDAVAAVPALKIAVVADKGFQDAVTNTLAKPADIAAVEALQDAVAANTNLRDAVKTVLAGDGNFISAVKVDVNAEAIREVMSKPVFEIPADDNAPLSWDW